MNVLAVGDVHGCYYTFRKLVEEHWNPEKDFLVQVGDLINKGKHSGKILNYARKLQDEFPYQVFFLMGNHEYRFINLYLKPGADRQIDDTRENMIKRDINLKKAMQWLRHLPLKWETPNILITHAGISPFSKDPFGENARRGVLHNRTAVKNIGKLQVHGHLIQSDGKIRYNKSSNSWCIDTGAWLGKSLSALRISYSGEILREISIKTVDRDCP